MTDIYTTCKCRFGEPDELNIVVAPNIGSALALFLIRENLSFSNSRFQRKVSKRDGLISLKYTDNKVRYIVWKKPAEKTHVDIQICEQCCYAYHNSKINCPSCGFENPTNTAEGDVNKQLECKVENGVLNISIGVKLLKFATMEVYEPLTIVDDKEFIKNFINGLYDEDENGTTPVHLMFDSIIRHMLNNGDEGFSEEPDNGGPCEHDEGEEPRQLKAIGNDPTLIAILNRKYERR